MPSAWTQNFYHAVFSTKGRAPLIVPKVESRLYAFLGGIARDLRCPLVSVGGMPDHVHLLLNYRADLSDSDLMQQIKGRSSKWMNETFPQRPHFQWQEGYGGFTVSKSAVPRVVEYIARQKEHHAREDFQGEFVRLLRKHGIVFKVEDVFPEVRAEEAGSPRSPSGRDDK